MPQLTTPPVQLSMGSYWQLVDVMKVFKATAAIHKYNPTTNSWDHISNMPTARYDCLVAVLPTNEMMAVGGRISFGYKADKVDIASISISESK